MPMRDRLRRAFGTQSNSDDGSSSISNTDTDGTTSTARGSIDGAASPVDGSNAGDALTKTGSRLTRPFTWGQNGDKDPAEKKRLKEEKKAERRKKRANTTSVRHPSERPMTYQNLKTQEMLSHFEFAPRKGDDDRLSYLGGVSPFASRPGSINEMYPLTPVRSREARQSFAVDPLSSLTPLYE